MLLKKSRMEWHNPFHFNYDNLDRTDEQMAHDYVIAAFIILFGVAFLFIFVIIVGTILKGL